MWMLTLQNTTFGEKGGNTSASVALLANFTQLYFTLFGFENCLRLYT